MADVIFTVTVPFGTGGGYYIDGVQKPIISVVTGGTFRFNQNDASNATHPLALSTTTSIAGRITTGVVYYLDGVTTQANYYNTTLFNAATVRYIEITVTQTSDFYYICNVHGAGMGNVMDVTVDSWGALNWSQGEWGHQPEDVTVSVTTPGAIPTTWGQSTYGNYAWNQITGIESQTGDELIEAGASVILSTNLLTSSVNTVSAEINFAITVSSNLINLSINSVFAGENVLVEVTTPGSSTTWGQGNFGQYAWNQITGSSIDLGEETITAEENITLTLSTNIVNISAASLAGTISGTTWGFQTWGSNAFAQTDNFITADSNLSLNTNLLNTTIGFTSENVNANTIVELTSPGNLPWGATSWGNGSWGNIGGMFISQGAEEEAIPSIEVNVIGNQLNTTIGIYSITADANLTLNTNLLTVGLGDEDAVPNTLVSVSTNLLNVSVGAASGEVLSTVSPTGVNMTASTGRLFIAAWAVVDIGVTNTWSVVDIAA